MGNKSYRIRTNVGEDKFLHVQLDQDYDVLEILSLKIGQEQFYRLHTSNYGVIVGRVLANGGFGVPNAKVSLFIARNESGDAIYNFLYPYNQTTSTNEDGIRYNLLPSDKVTDCHNPVGTFPSKQYMLDNDSVLEVFEDYYRYTTKTNDAGDYMFVGVPVGTQTLHMDLDLSDCGVLSQRPYDFLYKGYNIEQFENANQFKTSKTLEELSQIFTQDQTVEVKPFWGDTTQDGVSVGITRADINVNFKFETSCVFLGSVFSDDTTNGISKRCLPRKKMGKMENLRTGEGTIEIIRKRTSYAEGESSVEEFQIKGTQLIDGDGTWCFQIPMNLDYMITDEYGNLVATDNPEKGIATRTRARFRISMNSDSSSAKYFQAKVLVPNNPKTKGDYLTTYQFGSATKEGDFKDLFWNNVYSVKSYIPRLQTGNIFNNRSKRFTGIKTVNVAGSNNPLPYNHIRIQFPFYYTLICWLVKVVNALIFVWNGFKTWWNHLIQSLADWTILKMRPFKWVEQLLFESYTSVSGSFCPELSDRYFIPGASVASGGLHDNHKEVKDLYANTFRKILADDYPSMTGNTTRNINVTESYAAGGLWYPIQSGTTLYGYYHIAKNANKKFVGTLYVLGNSSSDNSVITGATRDNVRNQIYWGLALGEATAAENLQNEKLVITRQEKTSDSLSGLELSTYDIKEMEKGNIPKSISAVTGKKQTTYSITLDSGIKYTESHIEEPEFFAENIDEWLQCPYGGSNLFDTYPQYHITNGTTANTDTYYVRRILAAGTSDAVKDLQTKYNGDPNSLEAQSANAKEAEDEEKICLHPKTDYLVSCIEYNLAEELEIINFDFYNDWINGAIYMPRWARTVRVNRINGKTKLRSCSDDIGARSNKLKITETSPIVYNSNNVALLEENNSSNSWRDRALSEKVTGYVVHSEPYVTDKTTKVFYYIPSSFNGEKRSAILFATDIILLGSLSECNIYGIPSDFDFYLGSSYQMPPDLATTNLAGDDGSGISLSDAGCVSIGVINSSTNQQLWTAYTRADKTNKLVDTLTEDYLPITEEAGISWNKWGPNQGVSKRDDNDALYAPGGHFLGLACLEDATQTSIKSNVNLLRACEMGVSLSERQERSYYYDNGTYRDIYVVPNGLINKNDIYDHYARALFATLNHNELRTKQDTTTGYLCYDFKYLNPYSFGGEFSDVLNTGKYRREYNRDIKVNQNIYDFSKLNIDEATKNNILWESAHTVSRANEDKSNDYLAFRFGNDNGKGKYIGSSIYHTPHSGGLLALVNPYATLGEFIGLVNNLMNAENNSNYIPQFENSYYFYFGLQANNTAIDKFRHSYQAVCSKKEIVQYHGELKIDPVYDNNRSKVLVKVEIDGANAPFNIDINEEGYGDGFGIYTSTTINNWEDVKNNDITIDEFISTLNYEKSNGLNEYDKNEFYLLVDNDSSIILTVTTNDGYTLRKELGENLLDLASYPYVKIPFSKKTTSNTLSRNKTVVDGVIKSATGGYLRTTLPISAMLNSGDTRFAKGYIKIVDIEDETRSVTFGYGEMGKGTNEYIISGQNINGVEAYDLPIPGCGEYRVSVIIDNGLNSNTYISNIDYTVSEKDAIVKLVCDYGDELELESGKFAITDENRAYVAEHMAQYGKPFSAINLTTSINKDGAVKSFIGQGELYIPISNTESIDNERCYLNNSGEEAALPSTPENVTEGYSLQQTMLYIPTTNYSRVTRRTFNVNYYDDYNIYSEKLYGVDAGITVEESPEVDGEYIIKANLKNTTASTSRAATTPPPPSRPTTPPSPPSPTTPLKVNLEEDQIVMLRVGDNEGKQLLLTWAVVVATSSTTTSRSCTLHTIEIGLSRDEVENCLNEMDSGIALFDTYELPIYYVEEELPNTTITLTNRYSNDYYNPNRFTKATIDGWYPSSVITLGGEMGYMVNDATYNLPKGTSGEITETEILDSFTRAFFDIVSGTTSKGLTLLLGENQQELEVATGEVVADNTLNNKSKYVFSGFTVTTGNTNTKELTYIATKEVANSKLTLKFNMIKDGMRYTISEKEVNRGYEFPVNMTIGAGYTGETEADIQYTSNPTNYITKPNYAGSDVSIFTYPVIVRLNKDEIMDILDEDIILSLVISYKNTGGGLRVYEKNYSTEGDFSSSYTLYEGIVGVNSYGSDLSHIMQSRDTSVKYDFSIDETTQYWDFLFYVAIPSVAPEERIIPLSSLAITLNVKTNTGTISLQSKDYYLRVVNDEKIIYHIYSNNELVYGLNYIEGETTPLQTT